MFVGEDMRVCDFFIEGMKEWDEDKIMNLFSMRDFCDILTIPLSSKGAGG